VLRLAFMDGWLGTASYGAGGRSWDGDMAFLSLFGILYLYLAYRMGTSGWRLWLFPPIDDSDGKSRTVNEE